MNRHVIVRSTRRPDPEAVAVLEQVGVATAHEAAEQGKREQFQAGVLGLDVYGMRETLARLGVGCVDEPPLD